MNLIIPLLQAIDEYTRCKKQIRETDINDPVYTSTLAFAVNAWAQVRKLRMQIGEIPTGKGRIDDDGAHLSGCQCSDCLKTNSICPECGTKYWAEPTRPNMEECHHCGWQPNKK